jgi:hypothetical protein
MTNRRTFIKQSGIAGAGLFVAPNVFSFVGSPNEKVVIGMMGTNSRGFYLARMLAKLPNVEVGYICDVDETVMAKTIAEIEKETGKKPKGVKRYSVPG